MVFKINIPFPVGYPFLLFLCLYLDLPYIPFVKLFFLFNIPVPIRERTNS